MNLLEVKGLKKYFPIHTGLFRKHTGDIKAVDGVDFVLKKGQVLGLVGESGSGKSTIARAAIRLIEPTGGSIEWRGKSINNLDTQQLLPLRRDIQMVFQDPLASLNPRKTILESIGEAPLLYGLVNKKDQRDFVVDMIKKVGLSSDVLYRYPHAFSGGQQQRICIARALALKPGIIIFDEAVSALDVSIQAQILNLLIELKETEALSYLFISHDLSVIRHIADEIIVLYLGKVMERAPNEELFTNPKHPYTQALLSAIPKHFPGEIKQRMILKGEIPSASHPPSGCPFRTRCPYAQPICAEPPPCKHVGERHEYYCILD